MKTNKPPVGLVGKDGRVVMGETGEIKKHVRFTPEDTALFTIHYPIHGQEHVIHWRGNIKTTFIEGRTIRHIHDSWRSVAQKPPRAELIEGLVIVRDWLWSQGVSIKQGTSNIADQLWHRTSGSRKLPKINDEFDKRITLGALTQGPSHFYLTDGESWLWDISGAYAHATSLCEYPVNGWKEASKWSGNPLAYVYATVIMPPNLKRIEGTIPEPRPTPLGGIFLFDREEYSSRKPYPAKILMLGSELESIGDYFKLEEVHHSWEPQGRTRKLTNSSWRETIEKGRNLPGVAGQLVKRFGNGVWGVLASHGGYIRTNCKTEQRSRLIGNLPPRSIPVANIIVSSVRVRLWTEALTTMPVICAHTDSAIVPAGYYPEADIGNGELGLWKLKERMYDMQAFGVNMRRYHLEPKRLSRDSGRPWYHVFAGERGERANRQFSQKLRRIGDEHAEEYHIGGSGNTYRYR